MRGIIPHRVLAARPDNQQAYLQRDPAAFASFSLQEEVRVVAGLPMAASLGQYASSQRPKHQAVSGQEHRHVGAASLHT